MLQPGEKIPAFNVKDHDGNVVRHTALKGKKLILFFYPRDLTTGCINEACSLRDNYQALKDEGFEVIGVSADDERSHRKFINKYQLPFPLLADVNRSVIEKFGVWGPKKFMGREFEGILRTTFIIDEKLVISHVITRVRTKDHARQVLEIHSNK